MPCKECGLMAIEPDKSKESELVYLGGRSLKNDGVYLYPPKPADYCSYHRRKIEGHFDRPEEYYRYNRGPNEWAAYEKPFFRQDQLLRPSPRTDK